MGITLDQTVSSLLDPYQLDLDQMQDFVVSAARQSVDFCDLFLQARQFEQWSLEDGRVNSADASVDCGFGLRCISGEKINFAFADGIDKNALHDSMRTLQHAALVGKNQLHYHQVLYEPPSLYLSTNPLATMNDQDKVDFLHQLDRFARCLDPRVTQVFIELAADYEQILVVNSLGEHSADIRPLVHLSVAVVVEQSGRRERASAGGGARMGYDYLLADDRAFDYVRQAVRQALLNLEALPAPAGTMPVVLGPGWPAVLLHEAVGHGLEGDFIRKGSSHFATLKDQKVASDLCTIVDDGTLPHRRGSLQRDDEGVPTEKTILIENGLLKNFMVDRHNAALLKTDPTGNGRRESYAHRVMPRMTNTYMLPGQTDPAEILSSIEKGIYAVDFSGGQVDITSGNFVFTAKEAYWVERGQIKYPVKGATLIGNGPEVLHQVSMVGNDLALDSGIGTCGKDGQTVPVGVGQPTLKIDAMTVGGSVSA